MIQEIKDLADGLGLHFPHTIDPGVSSELPIPEADKYIKWNSAADAIENGSASEDAVWNALKIKGVQVDDSKIGGGKSLAYYASIRLRVEKGKQIKEKHPDLDFGVLSQGQTRVWVCGTPGHLETIQTQLTSNDEKTPAVFEPTPEMNSIPEEDEEEVENEEVENDSLSELSDAENLDEIYNAIDLPEEEAPPVIGSSSPQRSDNPPQLPNSAPSVLVSNSPQIGPEAENPVSPLFLEGISPAGEDLVRICLVADIPDYLIPR